MKFYLKDKAISLRKKGFSLKEISEKLKIAKSTASDWLKNVPLNQEAQERLKKKQILGQYKTQLINKQKRIKLLKKYLNESNKQLKRIIFTKDIYQLFCALFYWCEGNKRDSFIRFTNSDPKMIRNFLTLLRKSFLLDEKKFRALLHLHSYHNEKKQKEFWSKITQIPISQFNRSYLKKNTQKRLRKNYPGCIAISYYDAKIVKKLISLYNSFASYIRGVG